MGYVKKVVDKKIERIGPRFYRLYWMMHCLTHGLAIAIPWIRHKTPIRG